METLGLLYEARLLSREHRNCLDKNAKSVSTGMAD
jgi:hypothetical protein